MAALRAQAVAKTFDRVEWVLEDVDLSIQAGEIVVLMGRSGSGKTTLLNLFAGLETPSKGVVSVDGRDLAQLDEDARSEIRLARIGVVFQQFNLLPELTVLENVALPRKLAGLEDPEGKARELLSFFGIEDLATAFPATLSGGETQRTAIARALVNDPAILLADEPTSNLDEENATSALDALERVARELDTAVLVATHDPLVTSIADRAMHLREGTLVPGEGEAAPRRGQATGSSTTAQATGSNGGPPTTSEGPRMLVTDATPDDAKDKAEDEDAAETGPEPSEPADRPGEPPSLDTDPAQARDPPKGTTFRPEPQADPADEAEPAPEEATEGVTDDVAGDVEAWHDTLTPPEPDPTEEQASREAPDDEAPGSSPRAGAKPRTFQAASEPASEPAGQEPSTEKQEPRAPEPEATPPPRSSDPAPAPEPEPERRDPPTTVEEWHQRLAEGGAIPDPAGEDDPEDASGEDRPVEDEVEALAARWDPAHPGNARDREDGAEAASAKREDPLPARWDPERAGTQRKRSSDEEGEEA